MVDINSGSFCRRLAGFGYLATGITANAAGCWWMCRGGWTPPDVAQPQSTSMCTVVIAVISTLVFAALSVAGLHRLIAGGNAEIWLTNMGRFEIVTLALSTLCISLVYLFPMTVSGDDGGLFGGMVFFSWAPSVPWDVSCGSNTDCCREGFVLGWFVALEVLMFLGLAASALIDWNRGGQRQWVGVCWLVLMSALPVALVGGYWTWYWVGDLYLIIGMSVLTAVYLVWQAIAAWQSKSSGLRR